MRNEMIFTTSHELRIRQLEEDVLSLQSSKQGLQQDVEDLRDRIDDLVDNLEKVRLKVTALPVLASKPRRNAYDLSKVPSIRKSLKK